MSQQVQSEGRLYQIDAAEEIERRFGQEYIYYNAGGALAISREVLAAFSKLTGQDVIWVRGRRYWRKREADDKPGRIQSR